MLYLWIIISSWLFWSQTNWYIMILWRNVIIFWVNLQMFRTSEVKNDCWCSSCSSIMKALGKLCWMINLQTTCEKSYYNLTGPLWFIYTLKIKILAPIKSRFCIHSPAFLGLGYQHLILFTIFFLIVIEWLPQHPHISHLSCGGNWRKLKEQSHCVYPWFVYGQISLICGI